MKTWDSFSAIWCVDFEFEAPAGELPQPVCLVAHEIRSGRALRVWRDQLAGMREPPYEIGPDALFVAYYASAELGCHLALRWPMPMWTLDLFCEFRACSNGLVLPAGRGLLGALVWHRLTARSAQDKTTGRELVMRGPPWSSEVRGEILTYCEADVMDTARLLEAMRERIDLPQALLRGRFMRAAARIETTGIPVDTATHSQLVERWPFIQDRLIARVDQLYGGVFEGRTFRHALWAKYLEAHGIPWPRTATGRLCLDDDTFKEQARSYPELAPMRELRASLSQMRLSDLAIGSDNRNRVLLSAFGARTGRNTPSNSRSVFGPAVWLRSLITPEPGRALCYCDWSAAEFGTAAALSGDSNMLAAYESGDPYLAFARFAGAVPQDATKQTHGPAREQFKACVLAVQYGMQEDALAARIGVAPVRARELLAAHRRTFRRFWQWSDGTVDYAMTRGRLRTCFGWPLHLPRSGVNIRSLRNFPMQANGSEMLRLACCKATEAGIAVNMPVHDALLIEAPESQIDEAIATTRKLMADASLAVLRTLELRTDAKIVRHPGRYSDERGAQMWREVTGLLEEAPC